MEKFYSKIDEDKLIHVIYRSVDTNGRVDISPESEFLQLACLKMQKNTTFRPHKHIYFEKKTNIAQESWVVIKGSVKCIFYDLDDKILAESILYPGDCSITFYGGHNYLILEDNTLVYEYKTGPYLGQQYDKVFI